ncbi:MAG: glycoside hydrolase family 88 protein, partial [Anaerolineae bacterium]|nr:glycoside hydrolase family 88 protein [Anaerolineae bacterium]
MDILLLQHALDLAFQHVDHDAAYLTDFPHRTACGVWETTQNEGWVESFWAGLLWLRFAYSGSSSHEAAARHWTDRLLARTHDQTHDLGFLFEPSAVAGYRLTSDSTYRDAALEAAHTLKLRLRPSGFIQAFSTLDDSAVNKIVLIDTMMNLKLLNWATRESGDDSFAKAATTHASNTIRSHVRDDGRTYHVVRVDPYTGLVEGPQGGQGLTPQSCWSRG